MNFCLTSVKYVNVGPFAHLEVALGPGAIGVFGPNGSGKTSFLRLLYGGLTGDWSLFPWTKEKVVYRGAAADDPAFTEIGFDYGTDRCVLTRDLRREKTPNTLTIANDRGTETIRTGKALAERLQQMGMHPASLKAAVFQEHPAWVIEATPAVRADLAKVLCQTEACPKIAEAVRKALAAHPVTSAIAPAAADDPTPLWEAAIARRDAAIAAWEAGEALILSKARADAIAMYVTARDLRAAAAGKKAAAKKAWDAAKAADERDRQAATNLRTAATEAEALAESLRDAAAEARQNVTRAAQLTSLQAGRAKFEAEIARHTVPTPAPVVPGDEAKLRAAAALAAGTRKRIDDLRAKAAGLTDGGPCPTCGQALPDMTAVLTEIRDEVAGLEPKLAAQTKAENAILVYDQAVAKYERAEQARKTAHSAACQALAALPSLPKGGIPDATTAQAVVDRADRATKAVTHARAQAEAAERAAGVSEGQFRAAAQALKDASVEIPLPPGRPEDVPLLTSHREALAFRAVRAKEKEDAQAAVETLALRVTQYRERADAAKKGEAIRRAFEPVMAATHRDALPALTAAQFRHHLSHEIERGLARFQVPFSLTVTDSFGLDATDETGETHPAAGLSSGQRAVAAVVFWRAVCAVFGSGLLVLDEPTANLDPANVRHLRDALAAFTEELTASQQLIVVTHSADLRDAFSQVIDFDNGRVVGAGES